MEITPAIPEDRQVIDSYGPGRFKIAKVSYEGALFVLPDRVVPWEGAPPSGAHLMREHVAPLFAVEADTPVELLLVGTGARMERVPQATIQALREDGVAVDFMETGAACRTFNVLLAEGRPVAAALIPV
jgi:uncharacterized protein